MKFNFSTAPKDAVLVTYHEGDETKVIERDGITTVILGYGDRTMVSRRKLHPLIRKAVRLAREQKAKALTLNTNNDFFEALSLPPRELGRLIAENMVLANYEFTRYKSTPQSYQGVQAVFIPDAPNGFEEGVTEGLTVGQAVNWSRELSNTPGGDMTPTILADAVEKFARERGISVSILEKEDAESLGMGLILGVDKGSIEPMKFLVLEYWGAKNKAEQPIVLIGKGITFDTGGINLKPADGMLGMNHDMSGGAAVVATVGIAADLKIQKNIVALVPAVENAVSGGAYRPGDVLTSLSGKTVEVLNTDAEGRLILADAFTYAERYNPRLVIDVATLTGAALVAVGKRASVVITPSPELESSIRTLGEESGDYVWPLPAWDEYLADLKSEVADIANVAGPGPSAKSGGGCIAGGIFLKEFAKQFPQWAHLDIAPRMESIPEDNLAKGSAGAPIRLLTRIVESL